jgi:hypothetical protein
MTTTGPYYIERGFGAPGQGKDKLDRRFEGIPKNTLVTNRRPTIYIFVSSAHDVFNIAKKEFGGGGCAGPVRC